MARSKLENVLNTLRNRLNATDLAIGDRLPPEREFAHALQCSRETLRRALDILEAENEVWRHVGQGTFLGPRPVTAPLTETLQFRVTAADELIRARLLIEPVIAAEAARRATPADIEKLCAAVEAGRRGGDRFACQQADDRFHRTIAEVARNPILGSVLDFLSDARRRSPWQTLWDRTYRRVGIAEFKTVHSDQHGEVVSAIEQRQPEMALIAMRNHLMTIVALLDGT